MAYQIEVEKTYKSIITIMEGSEKDALRKAVQTSLSRGTVKSVLVSVQAKVLDEGASK